MLQWGELWDRRIITRRSREGLVGLRGGVGGGRGGSVDGAGGSEPDVDEGEDFFAIEADEGREGGAAGPARREVLDEATDKARLGGEVTADDAGGILLPSG